MLCRYILQGFNKIYNWNLAAGLKRIFAKHHLVWRGHPGPAQPHLVPTVTTIREFDEAITVHSFGEQHRAFWSALNAEFSPVTCDHKGWYHRCT
jgi:predicted alpha/beta-fold hydrolase